MAGLWKRKNRWLVALLALGILTWAFLPDPLPVETVIANRGPLQVTVDEEGKLRAHDRYIVASPVGGRLMRIDLREGDSVAAQQVLAQVAPMPLSVREREEQTAHVSAFEALHREAEERVRRAEADYAQAQRDRERTARLVRDRLISSQAADQARLAETTRKNDLVAARFRVKSAAADADAARAMLRDSGNSLLVEVRTPVAGQVLNVAEKSERVVTSGTSLMTIGDPSHYEVVLDVLSTEAVKVSPGMATLIENWGGTGTLHAQVRVVEPSAFTKISALGVEEQRVNVVADLIDPPGALGDGYRVEGRIVIWQSNDVLKLPLSCLFRNGEKWAVFVIEKGRAHLREVEVGHRSSDEIEITGGLRAGEMLIRHPSNKLEDNIRVTALKS